MASGIEEQSSQTTEVAASVQQMASAIVQNSRSANQTSEMASQATEKARAGSRSMKTMATGMDEIVASSERTRSNRSEPGRAGRHHRGAVVEMINDVGRSNQPFGIERRY